MKRAIVSIFLVIALVLIVFSSLRLLVGSYELDIILLHVFGGLTFLVVVGFHLVNNILSLKAYFIHRRRLLVPVVFLAATLFLFTKNEAMSHFKSWYLTTRVGRAQEDERHFEIYDKSIALGNLQLTVKSGAHFWYPQIAIWLEDGQGNYLQDVMVTFSTAKGVFYGNRTKANYQDFDSEKTANGDGYRRVDALPHWSHQRGKVYADGLYAPTSEEPLTDAISGATPSTGFHLLADVPGRDTVTVKVEVNVAFDDNAFYSEFSFPDDEAFHSGTGLLGQPSLIYEAQLWPGKDLALMRLLGHGHHSGANGQIDEDLAGITTAKEIVEWIVVRRSD